MRRGDSGPRPAGCRRRLQEGPCARRRGHRGAARRRPHPGGGGAAGGGRRARGPGRRGAGGGAGRRRGARRHGLHRTLQPVRASRRAGISGHPSIGYHERCRRGHDRGDSARFRAGIGPAVGGHRQDHSLRRAPVSPAPRRERAAIGRGGGARSRLPAPRRGAGADTAAGHQRRGIGQDGKGH